MTEEQAIAYFTLSGIEVQRTEELPNRYWPRVPEYDELRADNPWWFVKTGAGWIMIGRRKRVWVIDWEETDLRKTFLALSGITQDKTMQHVYNETELLQTLRWLKTELFREEGSERKKERDALEAEYAELRARSWEEDAGSVGMEQQLLDIAANFAGKLLDRELEEVILDLRLRYGSKAVKAEETP